MPKFQILRFSDCCDIGVQCMQLCADSLTLGKASPVGLKMPLQWTPHSKTRQRAATGSDFAFVSVHWHQLARSNKS